MRRAGREARRGRTRERDAAGSRADGQNPVANGHECVAPMGQRGLDFDLAQPTEAAPGQLIEVECGEGLGVE